MKFTKMHGIGNDYIFVNIFEETVTDPAKASIQVSDRHFGIGSDGLILIGPSEVADFRMQMFNADGSQAQMCGNGARCIGKYVYDNGMTQKDSVTLETLGGIKTLQLHITDGAVDAVTVNMGKPSFFADDIPVEFDGEAVVNELIAIAGQDWGITCVSVGNPHCVTFVDDVDALELEKIGPQFEHHPIFPERVNTEFIVVEDATHLIMRVWERGSGETLACGTGACASAAAAIRNGYCKQDTDIQITLRGGALVIRWDSESGNLFMTGPAETVCTGEIAIRE